MGTSLGLFVTSHKSTKCKIRVLLTFFPGILAFKTICMSTLGGLLSLPCPKFSIVF